MDQHGVLQGDELGEAVLRGRLPGVVINSAFLTSQHPSQVWKEIVPVLQMRTQEQPQGWQEGARFWH